MVKVNHRWALVLSFIVVVYASHGLGYCGCHSKQYKSQVAEVRHVPLCHEGAQAPSPHGSEKGDCCCLKSPFQKGESVVIQIIDSQGVGHAPVLSFASNTIDPEWGTADINRILHEHIPISPHSSLRALAIKQSFLI